MGPPTRLLPTAHPLEEWTGVLTCRRKIHDKESVKSNTVVLPFTRTLPLPVVRWALTYKIGCVWSIMDRQRFARDSRAENRPPQVLPTNVADEKRTQNEVEKSNRKTGEGEIYNAQKTRYF